MHHSRRPHSITGPGEGGRINLVSKPSILWSRGLRQEAPREPPISSCWSSRQELPEDPRHRIVEEGLRSIEEPPISSCWSSRQALPEEPRRRTMEERCRSLEGTILDLDQKLDLLEEWMRGSRKEVLAQPYFPAMEPPPPPPPPAPDPYGGYPPLMTASSISDQYQQQYAVQSSPYYAPPPMDLCQQQWPNPTPPSHPSFLQQQQQQYPQHQQYPTPSQPYTNSTSLAWNQQPSPYSPLLPPQNPHGTYGCYPLLYVDPSPPTTMNHEQQQQYQPATYVFDELAERKEARQGLNREVLVSDKMQPAETFHLPSWMGRGPTNLVDEDEDLPNAPVDRSYHYSAHMYSERGPGSAIVPSVNVTEYNKDIEEEMIQTAIEPSKLEVEESTRRQIGVLDGSTNSKVEKKFPIPEEDELEHADSSSIKIAEGALCELELQIGEQFSKTPSKKVEDVERLTTTNARKQLDDFQDVFFTDINLEMAIQFDDYCHNHQFPFPFIKSEIRGLFGSAICDSGPEFIVTDVDGEEPSTGIISSINNDHHALVPCVENENRKDPTFVNEKAGNTRNLEQESVASDIDVVDQEKETNDGNDIINVDSESSNSANSNIEGNYLLLLPIPTAELE